MVKKRMPRTNRPGLPRRVVDPAPHARLRAGSTTLPHRFLDETITFWQPHTQRTLTREDAREIVENLTGFFGILREWADAERLVDMTDAVPAPAASVERAARKSRRRKTRAQVSSANI